MIGAPKAATTSLHHYLDAHPEIAMTSAMEPHVFSGDGSRWTEERLWWYEALFPAEARVRGDASPGYASAPIDAEVPARIARYVPDARHLYLVRDPVERALAHYAQEAMRGDEGRPLEVAIDPDDPYCRYVACSRYATQLEAFRTHFDADRIMVLAQTDLRDRRRDALARAFEFVGVDPDFWDRSFETEHNVRGVDNVQLPGWIERARRAESGRKLRGMLPDRVRSASSRRLRPLLGRGRGLDLEPSAELRSRLAETLRPEAARLRELTGQAFGDWSV